MNNSAGNNNTKVIKKIQMHYARKIENENITLYILNVLCLHYILLHYYSFIIYYFILFSNEYPIRFFEYLRIGVFFSLFAGS